MNQASTTTVNEGDTVIVIEEGKPRLMLVMKTGETYQNKSGAYHHQTLIGKQYGTKIWSKSHQGYICLLRPSPYLITETVPHKTQILFQMDISMIIMMLDIRPTKRVVESGTGSGSLTSSIAQALNPSGRLFTYEFNEDRAKNGQELMKKLQFQEVVNVYWRDVYGNGFLEIENDNEFNKQKAFPKEQTIDAVFLDLPQPWQALDHAKKMIVKGGRLCNFSPCMEQVQKTCLKLKEDGWKSIETVECLRRQFERRVKTEQTLFQKRKLQQVQTDPLDESKKQIKQDEQEQPVQLETKQEVKQEQTRYTSEKKVYYTSGVPKSYGHTGFLTFATMI